VSREPTPPAGREAGAAHGPSSAHDASTTHDPISSHHRGAHPAERLLPAPSALHRAGEAALLAEYPDTAAVLAAAEAVRALAPASLLDLVPAERTLLLRGTDPRDLPSLAELLAHLPRSAETSGAGGEVSIGIVYDGEDLEEVAELLGMSTDALINAHSGATWTAAFGGFAPGFAYLVAEDPPEDAEHAAAGRGAAGRGAAGHGAAERTAGARGAGEHGAAPRGSAPVGRDPVGPPWEVPRRAEPRTSVPAGAVGLASRYCGIYPRPSPGGWQLIGRSDAPLFDVHREPPALLVPGTAVRFTPQRAVSRPSAATAAALARAAREAAAVPARLGLRRSSSPAASARPALEVLSPGPLTLLEDAGRPSRAAIGVSPSGAFDRGAMGRANRAVGTPSGAAVLETLVGPLLLRAVAPTVVAVSGAQAAVRLGRGDAEVADVELQPAPTPEQAHAHHPGDRIEVGPATDGLRLVLAVRGGIVQVRRAEATPPGAGARHDGAASDGTASDGAAPDGRDDPGTEVLGARSRDTLSGLGPEPLQAGDLLLVGPERGLDAVPVGAGIDETGGDVAVEADDGGGAESGGSAEPAGGGAVEIPIHLGPREALLGADAVRALLGTEWTVRTDSDRVGVRLDGPALPVPEGAGSVPSEPMLPGAIQVPPSGLPVVFGPDHPTTGGYPVIAVVTRRGLDRLAQAGAGTTLRFVEAEEAGADGTRWSPPG
jgi:allophanate hydrolase subunit 2/allophanate hydrolase subunit 1